MAMTQPRVQPQDRDAWRQWLEENHAEQAGVWLVTFKKSAGSPRLEYNDAVEEALCFGWIDSKPSKLDEQRSMLWFSPRKAKSGWSRINKQRVEKLMAEGRMHAAGLLVIEQSKANGSWDKLDEVEDLVVPVDLRVALEKYENAAENFAAFPRSARRAILEWILNAKKPETRARRVEETAEMASRNERANQWKRPS